jgi:hypothetical protein
MKTGYSASASTTISISPKCPTGFTPYVTVSSADTGKFSSALSGKKVCVTSVDILPTSYTAHLTTSSYYHTTSTVTQQGGGSDSRWVSDSSTAWTVWNAEPIPTNDIVSDTAYTENTGSNYWVLYCYPNNTTPVVSPPAYNCT